ncbi:nucleotidyltransferase family protein [Falsirhodobacter sp. 20TX0035]|uniref:nucleotidyltransferase family protein n=1 Tax=Falsirhodobacter sp. 20TX0035 TaxID=3022019 RepID=UPI00232A9A2E|nr:nucleotidyltransferase family protein [Falsirhodobacter sp. 20TX0035]MDB6454335.1 nucleotidyltransferase family protein [Falsirhodobacter sp. 20TX0035]
MIVGALLAAGASRRFGPQDKLLATLKERPLVAHAAERLARAPLDCCFAVVSSDTVAQAVGMETVRIPAGGGQADSLVAAIRHLPPQTTHLLIALGDMPYLRDDDLALILDGDGPRCAVAEGHVSPPALFPKAWFPRLLALRGDEGAGRLLRDHPGAHCPLPAASLRDIDRPGDLG